MTNTVVISPRTDDTGEVRFDATVTIPWDGLVESIEGLWSIESALAWGDMMLSTHGAKYATCRC